MEKDAFFNEMLSRQQLALGESACARLRSSTVAMAGFGGVGCLALELLARAGVGRFRLLEQDVYALSNLNRQVFATRETLGRPKIEVAVERIKTINPFADVDVAINERITSENMEVLLEGADIGIMATDSPASQIIWNQTAKRMRLRIVGGSACGLVSNVWVAAHDLEESCLRRLRMLLVKQSTRNSLTVTEALALDSTFFAPGHAAPSVGFVANTTACLQAMVATMYLAGLDSSLESFRVDFRSLRVTVTRMNSLSSTLRSLRRHMVGSLRPGC